MNHSRKSLELLYGHTAIARMRAVVRISVIICSFSFTTRQLRTCLADVRVNHQTSTNHLLSPEKRRELKTYDTQPFRTLRTPGSFRFLTSKYPAREEQSRRVFARIGTSTNVITIRVEAHILPSTKWRATASAEQLDLDRPRVGRIIKNVPLWNGTFRQTDEQSLHGICVCGAFG